MSSLQLQVPPKKTESLPETKGAAIVELVATDGLTDVSIEANVLQMRPDFTFLADTAWIQDMMMNMHGLFKGAQVTPLYTVFLGVGGMVTHAPDPMTASFIDFANYFEFHFYQKDDQAKSYTHVSTLFLKQLLLMTHILNALQFYLANLDGKHPMLQATKGMHFQFTYQGSVWVGRFHYRHRLHLSQTLLYALRYLTTQPLCHDISNHALGCLSVEAGQLLLQIYYACLYGQQVAVRRDALTPQISETMVVPSEFSLCTSQLLQQFLFPRLMEMICFGHAFKGLLLTQTDCPYLLYNCYNFYKGAYDEVQEMGKLSFFYGSFANVYYLLLLYNLDRLSLLFRIKFLWNKGVEFNRKSKDAELEKPVQLANQLSTIRTFSFCYGVCQEYELAWKKHVGSVKEWLAINPLLFKLKVRELPGSTACVGDSAFSSLLFTSPKSAEDALILSFGIPGQKAEGDQDVEHKVHHTVSSQSLRPLLYDCVPHQDGRTSIGLWLTSIGTHLKHASSKCDMKEVQASKLDVLEASEDDKRRDGQLEFWNEFIELAQKASHGPPQHQGPDESICFPLFKLHV